MKKCSALKFAAFLLCSVYVARAAFAGGKTPPSPEVLRGCLYGGVRAKLAEFMQHTYLFKVTGDPVDDPGEVQRLAKSGTRITPEILTKLGIPADLQRYYDPETGIFKYRPEQPIPLALENGDAKLSVLRVNWGNGQLEYGMRAHLLVDYTQILAHEPDLQLWITANDADRRNIEFRMGGLPKNVRSRIRIISAGGPGEVDLSVWAQDGSKPTASGLETTVSMELPYDHPEYVSYDRNPESDARNAVVATVRSGAVSARVTPFRFQGGDVIVGARNIFVGPAEVKRTMLDLKVSRAEAIDALSHEFGKPVIVIGPGMQAIDPHIDTMMSVVRDRVKGDEVVLLASQREAIELLLGNAITEEFPKDDLGFFRSVRNWLTRENRLTPSEKGLLKFLRGVDLEDMVDRENRINNVRLQLTEQGYRVIDVPDLSGQNSGWVRISGRPWMYNYTNSIFFQSTAIIPDMGIDVWGNYMKQTLSTLGYQTVEAKAAQFSFCRGGGVRCMTETYRVPHSPYGP